MTCGPRPLLAALLAAAAGCGPRPAMVARPYAGPPPEVCYALAYAGEGAGPYPVRIGMVGMHGRVVGVPSREGERYWVMFRGGGTARPAPGDSVDVTFSNGFSALELRLKADGGELSGAAWLSSDVVSDTPPPRARVTGRRIPCDPAERW